MTENPDSLVINTPFHHGHAPHVHAYDHHIPFRLWHLMWNELHSSSALDFSTCCQADTLWLLLGLQHWGLEDCLITTLELLTPVLGNSCVDVLPTFLRVWHQATTPRRHPFLFTGALTPRSGLPATTYPIWVLTFLLAINDSPQLLHECFTSFCPT